MIGVQKGPPLTVGFTMVSVLHGGLERDAVLETVAKICRRS